MKLFIFVVCSVLASTTFSAVAAESQCDQITNSVLADWRRWADAPESKKTENFSLKYSQADVSRKGILIVAKKGGKFLRDIDPLSLSVQLKDPKGTVIAAVPGDKLRTRIDPGSKTFEIIIPNASAREIKEKMKDHGDGEFIVTYANGQKNSMVQDLKLEGIVKHETSTNGRNALVVSSGNKTTAVIVPEPSEGYKAFVFDNNCNIEKVVYKIDGKISSGPNRNDCNVISHKEATGHGVGIDGRASLDCKLYYKYLPAAAAGKAPAAGSGAKGGS